MRLHGIRSGAALALAGVAILVIVRLIGITIEELHLIVLRGIPLYLDLSFWITVVAYVTLGAAAATVARTPTTGALATLAWLSCMGFFVSIGLSVAFHFLAPRFGVGRILGSVFDFVWNAVYIAAWSLLAAVALGASKYARAPAPPWLAVVVVVTLILSRVPELLGMVGLAYPLPLLWVFRLLLFSFYGALGACLLSLTRVKDPAPTGWPSAWQ